MTTWKFFIILCACVGEGCLLKSGTQHVLILHLPEFSHKNIKKKLPYQIGKNEKYFDNINVSSADKKASTLAYY